MLTRPQPIAADALERFRPELTGYCYRMLGSGFEADDAVQETMVRAWRRADTLQEPAALRAWLYRIATNVCFDMLQGAKRRARPMDLTGPSTADAGLPAPLPESEWVQPIFDERVQPADADPAERALWRESLRLAFVAALQHLPPKQRAVLILCEVLRWKASEAAELLGTTVASVNSALQRARATLDRLDLDLEAPRTDPSALDDEHEDLLARYVDAFERYDIDALVALLHEDATFQMPPHPIWLVGPVEVSRWMRGIGAACADAKLIPTAANGCPAVGIYKRAADGGYAPFNLTVLETAGGRIAAVHNFLFPELFGAFGLPARLEA